MPILYFQKGRLFLIADAGDGFAAARMEWTTLGDVVGVRDGAFDGCQSAGGMLGGFATEQRN